MLYFSAGQLAPPCTCHNYTFWFQKPSYLTVSHSKVAVRTPGEQEIVYFQGGLYQLATTTEIDENAKIDFSRC